MSMNKRNKPSALDDALRRARMHDRLPGDIAWRGKVAFLRQLLSGGK